MNCCLGSSLKTLKGTHPNDNGSVTLGYKLRRRGNEMQSMESITLDTQVNSKLAKESVFEQLMSISAYFVLVGGG